MERNMCTISCPVLYFHTISLSSIVTSFHIADQQQLDHLIPSRNCTDSNYLATKFDLVVLSGFLIDS